MKPLIPIKTLQEVGLGLGIDAALLTEEQLTAVPSSSSSEGSYDQ